MRLFVGPLPEPRHGQSVAMESIKGYFRSDYFIDTQRFESKYVSSIYLFLHCIIVLLRYNWSISVVYLSGSRSLVGLLREFPLIVFTRIFNYRLVWHGHGLDAIDLINGPLGKLYNVYCANRLLWVVLSEGMLKKIHSPSVKTAVVENFCSELWIEHEEMSKENLVVYYSNLMCSKGIIYFLNAAEKILAESKDCRIEIAGRIMGDYLMSLGKLEQEIVPVINRLTGLYADRFVYHGSLSPVQAIELLSRSKIFVLPSFHKTEAVPLSILEAMSRSNYIVTTDHNLLPTIPSKEGCMIIPTDDLSNLASYISELIKANTRLERGGLMNKQLINIRYSEKKYLQKIEQILK